MVAPQSAGTQTLIIHSTFLMLASILRVTSQPKATAEALAIMSISDRKLEERQKEQKRYVGNISARICLTTTLPNGQF